MNRWGRLIFYVTDVDALWNRLKDQGFNPEKPRDASWGERYFHMPIRTATSCRLPGTTLTVLRVNQHRIGQYRNVSAACRVRGK